MNCELCSATTDDGLRLAGLLQKPDPMTGHSTAPIDAWLLIHGTGSNFYAPGVLAALAERVVAEGQTVLRINTRGHDVICSVPGAGRSMSGGAAFENVAECTLDLRAWLDELVRRGNSRIVLAGHSMGGVKAIYSQAVDPHPNVVAIVGISPPRFCHAVCQSSPQAQAFRADFLRATELVAAGRGDQLMLVQQPLPLRLTATSFVAKYGPHDDYDIIRLLPNVACPTCLVIGSESVSSSPAFESTPGAVCDLQKTQPNLHLQIVPGANIVYSGQVDVPAALALDWARRFLVTAR